MNIRRKLRNIKRKLLQKPHIKNKKFPTYWFHRVLQKEAALIVQIGSNDGKTGDPLYELFQKNKQWKGLFVEPVPYLFERLLTNYPDKNRFRFENAAINDGEDLDFYWVDPKIKEKEKNLPFWFDQLGSFDRKHIENQLDGRLTPYIISGRLRGMLLANLFAEHQVIKIDVLHIDAEGFDWKILSQLDLKKHQPKFILFEHSHLSKKELADANNFLKSDYHLFKTGIDVFAVRKDTEERILADMRQSMILFEFV